MDQLLDELKRVGFSQYEARAYVALLQRAPVTGYELSKRSGVPRSMIYEVLGKLLDRGATYTVPSEPVTYAPVPAGELVERLKREAEETFCYLKEALGSIERPREVDPIKRTHGRGPVSAELAAVVEGAKEELWLSVWGAQIPALLGPVERAEERGVRVFSVLFEEKEATLGRTFHHDYTPPEVLEHRLGGRLHIAARDAEEVVIAKFVERSGPWALRTSDPALVLVATEYIRHDISTDVVLRAHGRERLDALWKHDPDLVQVWTGRRPEERNAE